MRMAVGLKRWMTILVVMMVALPSAWAQSAGGENTVYVVGTSQIRNGDMSTARQEAIADGLVMAVSRSLTDLLPAESIVGHFQVLNETVLSRTDQFVQDYQVLAESPTGNTYRLMARTTVSVDRLKGALKSAGIRLGKMAYPRVVLCLAEKGVGDIEPSYWWGSRSFSQGGIMNTVLSKALLQKGFRIVRPKPAPGGSDLPAELSAAQAQALAKRHGAQVVVVGLASAGEAANTMGGAVQSYRATVETRAYRASDGQVLVELGESASSAGGDPQTGSREAIERAAVALAPVLSDQLAKAWFRKGGGSTPITVIVQGIGGHIADFVKLRGALGNMSGVDSLQLEEMMSDTAALAVRYQGNASALADAVLLLSFDTFGIDIEQVGADEIRLRLVPN